MSYFIPHIYVEIDKYLYNEQKKFLGVTCFVEFNDLELYVDWRINQRIGSLVFVSKHTRSKKISLLSEKDKKLIVSDILSEIRQNARKDYIQKALIILNDQEELL